MIDWLVSFLLRDGSMITLLRSSLYTSLIDQSKDWEEAFYFSNIPEISSLRNKKWGPENMYTFSMFVYIVKVYFFGPHFIFAENFVTKLDFITSLRELSWCFWLVWEMIILRIQKILWCHEFEIKQAMVRHAWGLKDNSAFQFGFIHMKLCQPHSKSNKVSNKNFLFVKTLPWLS